MRVSYHDPTPEQGACLRSVVTGHVRFYGVPLNGPALNAFRGAIGWIWGRSSRRRSQRHRMAWTRTQRLISRWLPTPRNCHPYPLDGAAHWPNPGLHPGPRFSGPQVERQTEVRTDFLSVSGTKFSRRARDEHGAREVMPEDFRRRLAGVGEPGGTGLAKTDSMAEPHTIDDDVLRCA